MTSDDVLNLFRETGALLEGHFEYASGRHGRQFLQAARVLHHPNQTEALCKDLAARFADQQVDMVVGPATGGIILAYETARHLNCRAAFTEKEDGGMALKRGIRLDPGTRILVVEDIVTTGGSVQKSIDHLQARGAIVVGVGVLVDRSAGKASFDCPFESLATIEMENWAPDQCPLCSEGVDLIEPDDLIV